MEEKVIINNIDIANYVMFKLDKVDNSYTKKELEQIKEITINFENEENINLIFRDLLLFTKLEIINIRNIYIDNNDFNYLLKLKNLNNIYFEKCEFENVNLIALLNLKSLSLINCKINNYLFINLLSNLEQLSIINGNINISNLNKLNNLNYLQLSYTNIMDLENKINLNELVELHIDNTNINDLSFIKDLINLKILSIDKKQYEINKQLILYLQSKDIQVYNENMVEFVGVYDGV